MSLPGKRPLSQRRGAYQQIVLREPVDRLWGPRLPLVQPDRPPGHESTRPRSPNRSPLPALPTHPTPAMLTCDARPRSLSGNSTKMKLDPHNYNFLKKTCIGPPPPERIQNPPKNSRNRSGPPNIDPHNFNPQKKNFTGPPSKKKIGTPRKTLAIGAGPARKLSDTQREITPKRVTTLQRAIDANLPPEHYYYQ